MAEHRESCGLCHIDLANVSVSREGQEILTNVSMHIHCGQLTAVIGQNGAGKTTLIKTLLGEIPHTGTIRHEDHAGREMANLRIGYVPQVLEFDKQMPVTVLDFLASVLTKRPVWTGINKKTKEKAMEALRTVNAESLALASLGRLSGGELQRVLLAMAITPQPDLLVLDEPVSGVDQNGLALFLETVLALRDERHMAILLVSHDLSLVQNYADYVILLDKTVLCQGPPEKVYESPQFINTFYASNNKNARHGAGVKESPGTQGDCNCTTNHSDNQNNKSIQIKSVRIKRPRAGGRGAAQESKKEKKI